MSSTQISGSLTTRNYKNFKGVDFSNRKDEVSLYRSPDALNVWRNYSGSNGRCIETRPTLELLSEFDNTIFGIFFYEINQESHMIVHCGTKLYDVYKEEKKVIFEGMNPIKSQSFVYSNIFFLKDGINYLEYNGETCKKVIGYIPTTTISRNPLGGGTTYEDINLLSDYRKNSFCADGKETKYYLDVETFDGDYAPVVTINGKNTTAFKSYPAEGYIEFTTAPEKPLTDGKDNVIIQFKKHVSGYANRINKCTLLEVFDNRIFFSGNQDYPSTIFHSSLNNPRYISDLDYYNEGLDIASVKAMISGNNALWVLKEPSQANTTIYYHNPTIDSEYGKTYPSSHSSISIGCVSTGINFNDDIVFFSDRGMEGISSDVTSEQVVRHRSSLIDSRLLREKNYEDLQLIEWQGYLLVIVNNKIYLADSREKCQINDHIEYEWFYWEMEGNITYAQVKNGILYLCLDNKIYSLTKTDNLISYWTTLEDEFNYPQYQKTTNKKGCVIDVEGDITISTKINNGVFEKINDYKNIKGFIVARIKKKKWKSIQLKFSSKTRFFLYSGTLESYIGSYVKR